MKKIYFFSLLLCCLFTQSTLANIYYVINNNPSGTGSLGEAITNANSHSGKDSVYFNIPIGTVASRSITVSSIFPLPAVTDALVIDGTSQLAGNSFGVTNAKIQIKAADYLTAGLVIAAANCEVYGLYIHHFVDGLIITGGDFKIGAVNFGNVINDCTSNCIKVSSVITGSFLSLFVGTDTLGTTGTAPLANGISINGSKKITIGGKQAGVRNTISGNNNGIFISDSKFIDIQGNYIQLRATSKAVLPIIFSFILFAEPVIPITIASTLCFFSMSRIKSLGEPMRLIHSISRLGKCARILLFILLSCCKETCSTPPNTSTLVIVS
ncbi:MAG TPA: hypothetical protein PLD84_03615 [Chitinophagales bacterium]|nr:hypothetical protein [Chitinophagales bacterium]